MIHSQNHSVNRSVHQISLKQLRVCDVLIFTFIYWNLYMCRKLLYPFSEDFADFYNVSVTAFSFALSAYNVGGLASVLLTLLPSPHCISIRLVMFLLVCILSATYFLASFCYEFAMIIAVRMAMGFISKTLSSEMRGTLSVFTKSKESLSNNSNSNSLETVGKSHNNNNTPNSNASSTSNTLALRILFVETSWFTSSAGWIIVGFLLHRFDANYVWYFGSLCSLLAAIFCYFLPTFTVSDILAQNEEALKQSEFGANCKCRDCNYRTSKPITIWTQYHLYWFFMGQFMEYFGYCAFMATFGPFLQSAYGYNAEQLGFQTVFIAVAEGIALVVASITSRYKSNLWWAILSATVAVTVAAIFSIAITLWNGTFPIHAVWVMLFLYTLWNEHGHLNGIVCVLEMAPHGLESKSTLLSGFAISLGSITGAIIGPHGIEWFGYSVVIATIAGVQFLSIILWSIAKREYESVNEAKKEKLLELDDQSH